jgi:hypothetical protein
MIWPWKEVVGKRVKIVWWPLATDTRRGRRRCASMGGIGIGRLWWLSGGTAEQDAGARRGRRRASGIGLNIVPIICFFAHHIVHEYL